MQTKSMLFADCQTGRLQDWRLAYKLTGKPTVVTSSYRQDSGKLADRQTAVRSSNRQAANRQADSNAIF